ncbi:MAG: AhpC/TSA family protein [Gammaproteobacteria bacterium]|nr:AhpC/TSA family protein [Gammaproteobacteria bacterium]
MSKLMPRKPVPSLNVATLSGAGWDLSQSRPEHFSMVVFYRGLHCPVCRTYIGELDKLVDEFGQRGVSLAAISSDTEARARETQHNWKLERLDLGYGLDLAVAREWGLYISTSRGKTSLGIVEPERFSEPGVFLVRPDQTLYWAAVQTMPFARPHFKEMLAGLDFILKNDYPARGEA